MSTFNMNHTFALDLMDSDLDCAYCHSPAGHRHEDWCDSPMLYALGVLIWNPAWLEEGSPLADHEQELEFNGHRCLEDFICNSSLSHLYTSVEEEQEDFPFGERIIDIRISDSESLPVAVRSSLEEMQVLLHNFLFEMTRDPVFDGLER